MTTNLTPTDDDAVPPNGMPAAPAAKPASTPKQVPQAELVTLEQLALEMKVAPRDARMLLRLAAKQKAVYPNLGKDHVARQPWQWTAGSKALAEARKALSASAA